MRGVLISDGEKIATEHRPPGVEIVIEGIYLAILIWPRPFTSILIAFDSNLARERGVIDSHACLASVTFSPFRTYFLFSSSSWRSEQYYSHVRECVCVRARSNAKTTSRIKLMLIEPHADRM